MRLQSGGNANEGTVILTQWRVRRVLSHTEGVDITCVEAGPDLLVRVRWTKAGEPAPEEIDAEFQWPHTTTTSFGRLPFPGRGIALRAAGGGLLASGDKIALHSLHGGRFLIYDARATLTLSAAGLGAGRSGSRRFEVESSLDARRIEVRPIDYREAIEELLAGSSRDGHVDFMTTTPNGATAALSVTRFSGELKPEHSRIVGVAPDATILALRLNEAGGEPMVLGRAGEEGAALWKFECERLPSGPWLIYEAPECVARQRPVLKTVYGDALPDASALARAIGASEDRRPIALQDALKSMVADGGHPDWRLAEDLARLLGHLPLVFLDLWSRFASYPEAMAAMALRQEFSDGFLRQWSLHLPFLWELVPLSAWRTAAGVVRRRMQSQGCDDAVIGVYLQSRAEALCDHCDSLGPLLHVGLKGAESGRVVRRRNSEAADQILRARLYEDDDSPYQKLIRDRVDEEWPRGLVPELLNAVETWPGLKRLLPPPKRDSRDNTAWLPIVLAYAAIHDHRAAWLSDRRAILTMRGYRRLDPHWFQDAFATTCQRLLM